MFTLISQSVDAGDLGIVGAICLLVVYYFLDTRKDRNSNNGGTTRKDLADSIANLDKDLVKLEAHLQELQHDLEDFRGRVDTLVGKNSEQVSRIFASLDTLGREVSEIRGVMKGKIT